MNPKVIDGQISYFKVHFGDLLITKGRKYSFLGINTEITKEKL